MDRKDTWNILDALPVGVCIIDERLTVRFWNTCLEIWTGRSRTEMTGQSLHTHYPHLAGFPYASRIDALFHGGPPCFFSSQLHQSVIPSTRPDGNPRVHTTTIMPYIESHADLKMAIIILEDVTDLVLQIKTVRSLQHKTKATQDALSRANKKLNLLSSITRHDILNQVMGIKGYTGLLLEEMDQDSEQGRYVHKVWDIADVIQREITFTKDYQDMGINNPLWHVVSTTVEKVVPLFADHEPGVSVTTGQLEIFADPLLEKVFYNLIDNSVRHGGKVTRITISFQERDEEGHLVYEDNGCGIPDEVKPLIFQRGYGTNTGLGLFLIREVLDITGLTITENGTPGQGARFEILLPKGTYRNG
jgi:signal transduction histidine kinase